MKTLDTDPEHDPDPATKESPDYYLEGPYVVFTESFLQRRGFCCRSGCRHCPYGFGTSADDEKAGVDGTSASGD